MISTHGEVNREKSVMAALDCLYLQVLISSMHKNPESTENMKTF